MDRHKVQSSNVAAIAYDEVEQVLEVEFKPNKNLVAAIWQYSPVHISVYELMLDESQSVGSLVGVVKNDPTVCVQEKIGEIFACPECRVASTEYTEHRVCPTCEAARAQVAS